MVIYLEDEGYTAKIVNGHLRVFDDELNCYDDLDFQKIAEYSDWMMYFSNDSSDGEEILVKTIVYDAVTDSGDKIRVYWDTFFDRVQYILLIPAGDEYFDTPMMM